MVALALAILPAVVCTAFWHCGRPGGGTPWARDVCSLSRDLCHNPVWIALATVGMAAVCLMLRSFRLWRRPIARVNLV
jgi:hypothetical protein